MPEPSDDSFGAKLDKKVDLYTDAFGRGVGHSLAGITKTILHPIDNIAKPALTTAFDLSVIHAAYTPSFSHLHDDIHPAQTWLQNQPQTQESVARMQAGGEHIKTIVMKLINGDGPLRTEMLTTCLSDALLKAPKYFKDRGLDSGGHFRVNRSAIFWY